MLRLDVQGITEQVREAAEAHGLKPTEPAADVGVPVRQAV
jgi:hypothetical protein